MKIVRGKRAKVESVLNNKFADLNMCSMKAYMKNEYFVI